MNLQIRDPSARELAKRIAQRRHVSMTDAVVDALEAEYRRVSAQQSLAERLDAIADELGACPRNADGLHSGFFCAISRQNLLPMRCIVAHLFPNLAQNYLAGRLI